MNEQACGATANLPQSATEVIDRFSRLNKEIVSLGVRAAQPWLDAYAQFFKVVMPAANACVIPQTECPPYCACTLEWTVVPGDNRVGHIRIRNTSSEPIEYQLAATPLRSCAHVTEQTPRLEPKGGRALPNEWFDVQVAVKTDQSWRAGETYESEIRIRGKYERCVCVRIHVAPEAEACCSLEMGEIPKRVRADDWYRHFQCTELCFQPIRQRGANDPPDSPQ